MSGLFEPDLSARLATALFQPELGVPVIPSPVEGSLASHQPERLLIEVGEAAPSVAAFELLRSALQRATRPPSTRIGRPGATNTTLMFQVTVNGVGQTVGLLPSVPSTHAYQVPADAGVET